MSRLDCEKWTDGNFSWGAGGCVGGGEGSILLDGSDGYMYMLIEAPDKSLGCLGPGQNWVLGLSRAKSFLASGQWEPFHASPTVPNSCSSTPGGLLSSKYLSPKISLPKSFLRRICPYIYADVFNVFIGAGGPAGEARLLHPVPQTLPGSQQGHYLPGVLGGQLDAGTQASAWGGCVADNRWVSSANGSKLHDEGEL